MAKRTVEEELLDAVNTAKEEENNDENPVSIPDRTSPDWSDYVLSEFADSEVVIVKGKGGIELRYPKVHGLRRLANKLVGPILESYPLPAPLPNVADGLVAAYIYYVVLQTPNGNVKYADVGEVIYDGPDGNFNNIGDKQWAKFPGAIAVTRAEARALRKALGLNVVAWDELDKRDLKNNNQDTTGSPPVFINGTQKAMLSNFAKRLKLDLTKYINSGKYKYAELDKVSFSDAVGMVKQLEMFQRETSDCDKYKSTYNLGI